MSLTFGSRVEEVSAFGESGTGDSGDVWSVVCEGDYWQRDGDIMLKHVDTGAYLAASGHTFGRPINGQVQICNISVADPSAAVLL